MMGINVDLLKWFINFLIKKTSGSAFKNENISNEELAEELHKLENLIEEAKNQFSLSHWCCTFNILKLNSFFLFNPHISFNKVALHCCIIKIWFKIFNICIAHY